MNKEQHINEVFMTDSDIIKAIRVFLIGMCEFISKRSDDQFFINAKNRHIYQKMTAILETGMKHSDELWPKFANNKTDYLMSLVDNMIEVMLQVADPSIEHLPPQN